MPKVDLVSLLLIIAACSPISSFAQNVIAKPSTLGSLKELAPTDLFKQLSKSSYEVILMDNNNVRLGTASAVAVGPEEVITNKHVVASGNSAIIKNGASQWHATLVCVDPKHDLALLRVPGLHATPVQTRSTQTLEIGEKVYAIGSPKGYEESMTDGMVSAFREYDKARLIQTSAPISHGSSGGGLFDTRGRLLGITTLTLNGAQNINFALPVDFVTVINRFPVADGPMKSWSDSFRADLDRQLGDEMLVLKSNDVQSATWAKNAVNLYSRSVKLNPDQPKAFLGLGSAYFILRNYDKAVVAYKRSLALNPNSTACAYNLGLSYVKSGDLVAAQQLASKLESMPGANPKLVSGLMKAIATKSQQPSSGRQSVTSMQAEPNSLVQRPASPQQQKTAYSARQQSTSSLPQPSNALQHRPQSLALQRLLRMSQGAGVGGFVSPH